MSLSGLRFVLGVLVGGLKENAWFVTGLVLLMVLLRTVARRTWVALTAVTYVWMIRRFGLLALVATQCVSASVQTMPLAAASWYAPLALTTPVLVALVAVWSLYGIVTSQPGIAARPASGPVTLK